MQFYLNINIKEHKNRSSVGWLYTIERVAMAILSEDGHGAVVRMMSVLRRKERGIVQTELSAHSKGPEVERESQEKLLPVLEIRIK